MSDASFLSSVEIIYYVFLFRQHLYGTYWNTGVAVTVGPGL